MNGKLFMIEEIKRMLSDAPYETIEFIFYFLIT